MFWIVRIESGLFILTSLYWFSQKKKSKSIIVKFTPFRHKTLFYRGRKNLKNAKVKLDLTKSRFDFLKRANNHVKEIPAINFCYADVNCRLRVKCHDEKQEDIFFLDVSRAVWCHWSWSLSIPYLIYSLF